MAEARSIQSGGRLLLFGDPFGVPHALQALPREVICGLVGSGLRLAQHNKLKRIASEIGLPLLIQPKASAREYSSFLTAVKQLRPDVFIVNSYSLRLRKDLLQIPQFGSINIHGALLPEYRGCNPIQWAIINNEQMTGVTMHFMDEDIDAGEIIAQRKLPILFADTWKDVHERIGLATEHMLRETAGDLLRGRRSCSPQDVRYARYWPRRHPHDGKFEWKETTRQIYNKIRALVAPLPGAFYVEDGIKCVIDSFMPIGEVARRKFGREGMQQLLNGSLHLNVGVALKECGKLDASSTLQFEVVRKDRLTQFCHGRIEIMDGGFAEVRIGPVSDQSRWLHSCSSLAQFLFRLLYVELEVERVAWHLPDNGALEKALINAINVTGKSVNVPNEF